VTAFVSLPPICDLLDTAAMTWTHRDAQTGEAFKTLLLEGYGNGRLCRACCGAFRCSNVGKRSDGAVVRSVTARGREYKLSKRLDDRMSL